MADLSGDGIDDLFTGCFEGGIYLLRGDAEGGFAAPEKLLDKKGDILRLGQYWDYEAKKWTGVATSRFAAELGIGAAALDWEGDGDLDLILGSNGGALFLRLNEGTRSKPAFATESVKLEGADGALAVPGGHAIPTIADWDGDGLPDILSGTGNGGVVWFRNVGKKHAPAFAKAAFLLAANPAGELSEPSAPGQRTQVAVADHDGDGDLDLLVGDYNSGAYTKENRRPEMHGWVWLVRRAGGAEPREAAAGTD